jgi:hypothetical protein
MPRDPSGAEAVCAGCAISSALRVRLSAWLKQLHRMS